MQCKLIILKKIDIVITMRDIKGFIFHLQERSSHMSAQL